jgi:hypothetical protein
MATAFLGVNLDTWVKILLGWLTAALIGMGGWFLQVRDGLSDRPTKADVELKIEATAAESRIDLRETAALLSERASDQRAMLGAHAEDIKAVEISAAAFVEAQKSQKEQLTAIQGDLKSVQSDLTKLLRRGN